MNPPVALTVAGTDSGGAAGIAADLATFAALGTHGACAVTAVTAQDTIGVRAIHPIPPEVVRAQLDAALEDLPVGAVKTGMLGTAEAVVSVSEALGPRSDSRPPLVVDPVLIATSGAVLGDDRVRRAYLDHLLPIATLLTPNLDEARALAAETGPPERLATLLAERGATVVVTGGDPTAAGTCTDWLAHPGATARPLTHPAIKTTNDHGTGCTYSAAVTARLAAGVDLVTAVEQAAAYVARQLRVSSDWTLGRGRGPIAHVAPTDPMKRTGGEA